MKTILRLCAALLDSGRHQSLARLNRRWIRIDG
jgi:hypothetical protein